MIKHRPSGQAKAKQKNSKRWRRDGGKNYAKTLELAPATATAGKSLLDSLGCFSLPVFRAQGEKILESYPGNYILNIEKIGGDEEKNLSSSFNAIISRDRQTP
jgi:hypothetical protein